MITQKSVITEEIEKTKKNKETTKVRVKKPIKIKISFKKYIQESDKLKKIPTTTTQ